MVKADAYGHGAEEVTAALADIVDVFAVATVEEGLAIRTAAMGKDILVLTPPVTKEDCYRIASNRFIASIPDLYTAKLAVKIAEEYRLSMRIHLQGNTGMNRYGMNPSMLGKVCKLLQGERWVKVDGLYSHLYTCDREISYRQREIFLQMQRIVKRYFSTFTAHLGATYGGILGEDFSFDMVRIGIGLYGYTPTKTDVPLYKGMEIFAPVVANRKYSFGGVGYGVATVKKGERLSICRVGYADGFLRKRDNGTVGWEKNANDLCMDGCIRKSSKRRGDWETVFIDADETAIKTGTVSYEVLCAATRRAIRIYDND